MKIKICGMKFPNNINEIGALQPDYMGFIFYPKSKRFVGENFSSKSINSLPKSIKKVGVFVNESVAIVLEKATKYKLDAVQLHGNESVANCKFLKENNIEIIKAFSIDASFDFEILKAYESVCDYFLFDTKTPDYGGSGQVFDWKLLEKYTLQKPFFLSGGLNFEVIEKIKNLNYPMLVGLDFNSQLENDDFSKNIQKTTQIIQQLQTK
jgi:phosphoribosylanthranilate isomerase